MKIPVAVSIRFFPESNIYRTREARFRQKRSLGFPFLRFQNANKKRDPLSQISHVLERVTRLELATSTLARWRSTG